MWQGISLKSEINNPWFKPLSTFYCTQNQLFVPQYKVNVYNFGFSIEIVKMYLMICCFELKKRWILLLCSQQVSVCYGSRLKAENHLHYLILVNLRLHEFYFHLFYFFICSFSFYFIFWLFRWLVFFIVCLFDWGFFLVFFS